MKKFLAIFLVFTLLFAFAACDKNGKDDESSTNPTEQTDNTGPTSDTKEPSSNKKDETTTAEPFENPNLTVPEALFDIVSVNDYTLTSRTPLTSASTGETTIGKRYERKQAMTTVIPNKITADSTEITIMQTTVRELMDKGWTAIGKTDTTLAIKAGKGTLAFLKNDQGRMLSFNVMNTTTNVLALADCTIAGASVLKEMNVEYDWVNLVLGDKVGTNSSYEDIVSALGNPLGISVKELFQKDDYVKCDVTLLYEYKAGNTTYDVAIGYVDENGKATLNSFIISTK